MLKRCRRFLWVMVVLAAGQLRAGPASGMAEVIVLTPLGGDTPEDREIARWQTRAAAPGAKADDFARLGWALVGKARRTLDAGFYKLAEMTADASEARFGGGVETRLLRAHVWHNLHRFREAEGVARELVAERGQPPELALLSDVLMEQGRLGEAVEILQRMVNLQPGAEALSRIAHVRWLKGDLSGAREAMESARRARHPRDGEAYAWTLVRLSGYDLQAGRREAALAAAEAALRQTEEFAPALFARGRALLALARNEDAVADLRRAAELNPLPEYQWWLADGLRAVGRCEEAVAVEAKLTAHGEAGDPRTLALYWATRGEQAERAVRLAREELAVRADVLTHDALAWALAAAGETEAAARAMDAALAEKTQDARLFLHAGEIARASGRPERARDYWARATAMADTLTPGERALLTSRSGGDGAAVRAD